MKIVNRDFWYFFLNFKLHLSFNRGIYYVFAILILHKNKLIQSTFIIAVLNFNAEMCEQKRNKIFNKKSNILLCSCWTVENKLLECFVEHCALCLVLFFITNCNCCLWHNWWGCIRIINTVYKSMRARTRSWYMFFRETFSSTTMMGVRCRRR